MVLPSANAAVHYQTEAFSTGATRVLGRQSAGEGFLDGFLRHGQVDTYYCYTNTADQFARFSMRPAQLGLPEKNLRWIPPSRPHSLAKPGCLFHSDPGIGRLAWKRRRHNQRAYSLCGVHHTLCSLNVLDALGELLLAPVQPWDVLVCTSTAAKRAIEHVLEHWSHYLAARVGSAPPLPVIPLGVDCDAYRRQPAIVEAAHALRRQHGIGKDDVVALFVGRLSFHAKAHPLPMYTALEEAGRRTGKTLHLLQVGWFANDSLRRQFHDAAQRYCPSVRVRSLDGRNPITARAAWAAADLFTSLADNIQETFGLTPIEAMAAGLPQVVADWDGYRATVRHGVDGFRIPTMAPAAGCGEALIRQYDEGLTNYDRYIGQVSQATAVDAAACAEAFCRLIENPELRRTMGAAARRRAEQTFDWRVVISAYRRLWEELGRRRIEAEELAPRRDSCPAHPLRDDPFAVFASYPTQVFDDRIVVMLAPLSDVRRLDEVLQTPMMNFAVEWFASRDVCLAMLDHLARHGPCEAGELYTIAARTGRPALQRTLGWLLKMDVIRLHQPLTIVDGDCAGDAADRSSRAESQTGNA